MNENHHHNPFRRHSTEVLSPEVATHIEAIKVKGEELYYMINAFDNSRETALARTKLEEAIMWVIKGLTA